MDAYSSRGVAASIDPADASRLAAAATAMMEGSVSLTGNTAPAAKAQMMAALTNVAANRGEGGKVGSSRRWAAENGEWQVVCELLSVCQDDSTRLDGTLAGCFSSSSGCADAATAVSAAGKQKELGSAAFKQGSFSTALQHYQAALASLQASLGPIPSLLSSRAKAWLQQPSRHSQQHAFMDGLTAALLDPKGCAGGFHTAAVALLQLDEFSGAQAWCELGLQLLPGDRELQEVLRRIRTTAAVDQLGQELEAAELGQLAGSRAGSSSTSSSSASGASSSKSQTGKGKQGKKQPSSSSSGGRPAAAPMTERQIKEMERKGTASVEQVSMVNQLAELAARMDRGGRAAGRGGRGGRAGGRGGSGRGRGRGMSDAMFKMMKVDERVPNLHEEFAKGGW
jgi:tetratricopeptide (TPR) repeat protein